MKPFTLLRPLVACLVFAALALPAAAEEKPEEKLDLGATLPIDPGLERMSGLPNGMRYWIRPHAMPAGKVTIYMHISSGSLNEEDSQRGLAHFLEHMAFNGSKHFPPGEVVKFFESMGMRFGQHQNAFTSFDQTTYVLSLPDTKPETLEKALLFFSDVGNGLSILPTEVDKERGVIEEEQRARSGVGMRMMEKVLPVLMPGSRISKRLPIGIMEVIQNAPPERLRAYYEKWYRPDLTTMIVVGDIDPKLVEPMIKKTFATWKKPASVPTHATSGIKAFTGVQAAVFSDPEQANVEASVNFVRTDPPMQTVQDLRTELIARLGRHMLNRRLRTISQENKAAYLLARVQGGQPLLGHDMYGFEAQSGPAGWERAFSQVIGEVRRVQVHGFGAKEFGRAKSALLSRMGQMSQAMSSIPSMMMGRALNDDLTRGHRPISPAQVLDLATRLFPEIGAEEVQVHFRLMFDLDNAFLTLSFPEKDGVTVPTKEELLRVYANARQRKRGAVEERADLGRILQKDPAPAPVVARIDDADLGVTSLTFGNGARVHIKPIDAVQTVQINVKLYGGVLEETQATKGLSEAAAVAWSPTRMATKSLKPVDIGQFLSQRQIRVSGGQDDISFELSISGPPKDLEDGLRLAYLLLTEPRVDKTALAAWKQQRATMLKRFESSAQWQAVTAMRDAVSDGDVRLRMGTLPLYQSIAAPQAQAWLDRIIRSAPIEVVISGGIDRQEAERLASTWFGSLPRRPDRIEELRALRTVKLVEGPLRKTVAIPTITPQAFVLLGWRGVDQDDAVGQIALVQASTMLSTHLINAVREERGLTYSIGSGYQFTNFQNLDGLVVQFTADPKKALEAAQVAKETVLAFLAKGPTAEEISATEKQMKNVLDAQSKSPSFWIQALGAMHGNGRTLAEIKARLAALQSVDKEALMAVLRQVLRDERFARVIAGPAPAGK